MINIRDRFPVCKYLYKKIQTKILKLERNSHWVRTSMRNCAVLWLKKHPFEKKNKTVLAGRARHRHTHRVQPQQHRSNLQGLGQGTEIHKHIKRFLLCFLKTFYFGIFFLLFYFETIQIWQLRNFLLWIFLLFQYLNELESPCKCHFLTYTNTHKYSAHSFTSRLRFVCLKVENSNIRNDLKNSH